FLHGEAVFLFQLVHDTADGFDRARGAYPLAGAPEVAPGTHAAGAEDGARLAGGRQVGWMQAGGADARHQVVAGYAGETGGVEYVRRPGADGHLLVGRGGAGFLAGDETGAQVGKVRTHRLGGEDAAAGGDGAGEDERSIIEA